MDFDAGDGLSGFFPNQARDISFSLYFAERLQPAWTGITTRGARRLEGNKYIVYTLRISLEAILTFSPSLRLQLEIYVTFPPHTGFIQLQLANSCD